MQATKQQQVTKQAKAQATKQASKQANAYAYAALLSQALAGKFGAVIQRFYVSAIAYHTKQKTQFPRGRIADVALLPVADAESFISKHAVTSIPAGSTTAQRFFDQMMIEAQEQASKQASK